ncbi:hypothetical protein HK57_00299 [Aspergillus ustus]|uniref:CSD domain-containing protein n=1 Tax=Aspergillus ustus TaxID=40382 RepID=A0A0C1EGV4_ASPUT|nr:hypothetical protein HK57_00299 [Aspergillus ustus]
MSATAITSPPAINITLPLLLRTPSAPSSPVESKLTDDTMTIRQFGTIKWYNDAQGFGFITSEFGGELIIRSQALIPAGTLREGMRVSYEAVQGPVLLMADQVQPAE